MKKLVFIALFSFAITASAVEKKEIVEKEVLTEQTSKVDSSNEIIDITEETLVDCTAEGNNYYSDLRYDGASHREARSKRREFVRECRGGTWAWVGFCIGFIGKCD